MSVYQRQQGGTYDVSWFDEHGKRHRKSTGLKNKKRAQRILEDVMTKVRVRKFGIARPDGDLVPNWFQNELI